MFLRLTSSTLALTLLTAPAFALTPEEVWNAWVADYGRAGYTVTEGARDLAGEVLTLTDVTVAQGDEDERLSYTVPRITLTGTGDGKVRATFSEAIALQMTTRDAEDRPATATGTIRAPGMEILSSGEAAARTDALTAPSVVATLDRIDLPEEGDDLSDVASVTLTDLTAQAVSDGGTTMTSTSRAAKLDYAIDYATDEGSLKASGTIADVEGSGEVVLPAEDGLDFAQQMNAALKAGARLGGTLKLGAGSHDFDFTGTDSEDGTPQSGKLGAGMEGAEVTFRIAADGLTYQGAATGLTTDLNATGLPAPISYALEEATFDVQGPVMASGTPAPFKLAYSLGGLTLGDEVWKLMDPAGKLPRDPASLDIDLTGLVRLNGDLFDPDLMKAAAGDDGAGGSAVAEGGTDDPAEVEGAEAEVPADGAANAPGADAGAEGAAGGEDDTPMPFEVTEVTINQFALSAAGVKAEATGKLSAPEGGDISEPVGSVSARYQGVNGLIDTLVAMGLISQDEVMGYRMMLTMFARPAEGEDVLTTELQFNPGGEIIANGQKIK